MIKVKIRKYNNPNFPWEVVVIRGGVEVFSNVFETREKAVNYAVGRFGYEEK